MKILLNIDRHGKGTSSFLKQITIRSELQLSIYLQTQTMTSLFVFCDELLILHEITNRHRSYREENERRLHTGVRISLTNGFILRSVRN